MCPRNKWNSRITDQKLFITDASPTRRHKNWPVTRIQDTISIMQAISQFVAEVYPESRHTRFSVIGHVPIPWLIHRPCREIDIRMCRWRRDAQQARPSPFPRRTRFNAVCIRERSRFSMQRSISSSLYRVAKWFNNEQSDQDSRSRPRPMHFTIARACTADVDDGRMSLIDGRFLRLVWGLRLMLEIRIS